ncbi:hypothetical protein Pan44_33220 [Caulifigura coniformis]|uniref:Uncharacterized protein n=1 Tax=Caulifigura coniformis TaxID=2527983 RepID=A0A517SGM6_9PLAN|nr:hypothetical protein [Caulifigura coniformis]QDT55279.1 hypothetical protein Pan44_33220 [Caulifigura coniformis]
MGWKCFAVFATDVPAYFSSLPPHDPEAADRLREKLGLSDHERVGRSIFDEAMYPDSGTLFLGAYPHGAILCDVDRSADFFDDVSYRIIGKSAGRVAGTDFRSRFLQIYPNGEVLAVVLSSVVNLWGYAVYSRGKLIRVAAGTADDPLFANEGEPLPEEAGVLRECPMAQVDRECRGEDLVFDVMAGRMLGRRVDDPDYDEIMLELSEYRKRDGGVLSRIKSWWDAASGGP